MKTFSLVLKNCNLVNENSIEQAFNNKTIVIILTNHSEFENLSITNLLLKMNNPSLLFDLWSNYNPMEIDLPVGHGYLGLGNLKNAILP